MPKPLVRPKEEPGLATTPAAVSEPRSEHSTSSPIASTSTSVDVSLIFMLYKKCIADGYPNCDVLKQMAIDAIKERLKSAIEAEVANLIEPELRGQIGQICIEI
jgi:hypothetical protein